MIALAVVEISNYHVKGVLNQHVIRNLLCKRQTSGVLSQTTAFTFLSLKTCYSRLNSTQLISIILGLAGFSGG